MRAAEAALRPATVVRADVDAGEDDLAMALGKGTTNVREDRIGRQRPLRAASARDDAVGAIERAAVLNLDERTRPLDRCALVIGTLDRDGSDGLGAGQRRKRLCRAGTAIIQPHQALQLGDEAPLR